ncbi:MAG: hypothetical protein NUK65_13395, partial [Firmicutes bacterium]|nr:hypothetical protein [Bacillota bacterium]
MSNPKVYAQLTDLYTNIVQRVIHYQKMAESSSRDNKIDTVFHQLIEEEKAHLKTLGSVIIELLSEQETSKQKDSLLSSTLPAELMLL